MRSLHALAPLNALFPSARVVSDSGFIAPLQCSRPAQRDSRNLSLVARLSNAGRRVTLPNDKPRFQHGATNPILVQATLASADGLNSGAPPEAAIPRRTSHSIAAVVRGYQQRNVARYGGAGRRIHPIDCAPARSTHIEPHQNTKSLRQAARAGIGVCSLDSNQPLTYLGRLGASVAKTVVPAAMEAWGGNSACHGAVEEDQRRYRRHCLSDVSGEVEFVSPVRKGFQNDTAEYVAMLLRYAKVQEARSPSFRKKSPPPICIPAKAA